MSQLPPGFVLDTPAPSAPQGPSVTTMGPPPKPEKPEQPKTTYRTLTPDEVEARGLPQGTYQISSEGKIDTVGTQPKQTPAQTEQQRNEAIQSLRDTIDKIDSLAFDAGDNNGWGEVGFTGSVMKKIPGTAARDLAGNITSVQANTAFDKLQNIKQNSPNGSGLGGNTSDADMALLKASVANLDQSQSLESFFSNLAQAKKAYLNMLGRLDPAAAEEYAKKKGIRFDDKGNPSLVYVEGEDKREKRDPFGVMSGSDPNNPDGGGNGGGGPDIGGPIVTPDIATKADEIARMGGNPSGLSGLTSLAQRGITLGLSDEAAGAGGFLANLFQGKDPRVGYVAARDARRRYDEQAVKEWPFLGRAAEFLGGGGAGKVASGATSLMDAARTGATLGGIAGFGYGNGAAGSATGAAVGGATGGLLGAAMHGVGERIANRAARNAPDMEVVQAGQRQQIPIRQPDARPALRGEMAQAETTQSGGPMIRAAREADQNLVEQRVGDIGGAGNASDPYALGSRVQEAGQRYIVNTRAQANRLYDRARQAAGGATVTARNADAAIDANIQELRAAGENSNAAAIRYLEGLREDIDRGLTLESVQNLRTNMRGQIGERGLTGTDTERRVGQVIDAMNQDLTEQLPREASEALRAADGFYRQRQDFINGTLKQFMGDRGNPLPAETAASRLVSMAQGKGNYQRFSRMWGQLDPGEQADVAATIAHSLGRKANGEFSISTLVRSLDPAKGINPRTARLVFGDDGANALQDLRVIARAKTETGQALNNSRTGVMVNQASSGLKSLIWGALGLAGGGPVGAVAAPAARNMFAAWGEQRAARMLLNPDFTRWLRNAPNSTDPAVVNRYMAQLSTIRGLAANDNQAFTNALGQALSRSPATGVAAQGDENEDVRRKPVGGDRP